MLAMVLVGAGEDPGFLVGAPVPALGGAAAHGDGRWFVVEADESDGSFLAGPRAAALVTNVEPDHLEYWGGWDQLLAAFERFLVETAGPTVVCADDPVAAALGRPVDAVVPTAPSASTRPTGSPSSSWAPTAPRSPSAPRPAPVAVERRRARPPQRLQRRAALAVAEQLGVDLTAAAGRCAGTPGSPAASSGAAEAPASTSSTTTPTCRPRCAAALGRRPQRWMARVVAVFQPHRYRRTQALWHDFADAFVDADVLVLTDVYAAGEAPRPGVTGKLLVDAVLDAHPAPTCAVASDPRRRRRLPGRRAPPRRPVPHPRRRRPDDAVRPGARPPGAPIRAARDLTALDAALASSASGSDATSPSAR